MWNKKIQKLAQQEIDGMLPSILFPHAVVYYDNNNSVLCWECANSDKEESVWTIVDYDMDSWSEFSLTDITICDSCSKPVDPALR